MHTLRDAAEQLAAASSVETLAPIAAALGCAGLPATFDDDTRTALGLGAEVVLARVATGPGALRAMLLEVRRGAAIRELLGRVASRLQSRTPHLLWVVLATECDGTAVGVAAWSGDRRPPRLCVLVADRSRIVDSDAETLRALASVRDDSDLLTHARWVELLGRDALTRRFYRALERVVRELASSANVGTPEQRAEVALLYASRLLFLAFLEGKSWLDGDRDFLAKRFDQCMATGGDFHRRVLLPLFFGTLNTPTRSRAEAARKFGRVPFLNGGLFARTPTERLARGLRFSDDALGAFVGDLLARYRFTAREESTDLAEVAVDPEMLGRAFESLMASTTRRESGAFYTPFALVEHVSSCGLQHALEARLGAHLARRFHDGSVLTPVEEEAVRASLLSMRVMDPSCGSGAFLVHCLERLAALVQRAGDVRPLAAIRRDVLTRCIFGVDVNPTAVWLCELRLWLSVVIESGEEDPLTVPPLPNLDRNVRCGDSLGGRAFGDPGVVEPTGKSLVVLRQRYTRATGSRKERLARELDRQERRRALALIDAELRSIAGMRTELAVEMRRHDLFGERHRPAADERARAYDLRRRKAELRAQRRRIVAGSALPFTFATHFPDAAAAGGFDLVVGNPPWVRPHHIARDARAALRERFRVARAGGWRAGAELAGAGMGFAAQVDLAALFAERSLDLLARDGVLALLLPVKLWRSLAGGGVRDFLFWQARLLAVEDLTFAASSFDAVVYPSLLVAARAPRSIDAIADHALVRIASARAHTPLIAWEAPQRALPFDDSPGAPWLLLPREVRDAFQLVRANGTPLAESRIGRPTLGVKCGCNAAFIVRCARVIGGCAEVLAADGRSATIDAHLLRPLLRGEGVRAWMREPADELLLWTHGVDGRPLERLPSSLQAWLAPWRKRLTQRSDARGRTRWWGVFRIEAARCGQPRVVWSDVGRAPRALVLSAGDPVVPLNSCYVVHCRDEGDALAFAALLNSALACAWLAAIAEPARGRYLRFLGWTMSLLPLPRDWERAREVLCPLARRAVRGNVPDEYELLAAVLDAYRLRHRDVAPLLAWSAE